METVVSKDGVKIGFSQSGDGPHLVLVHGTAADHTRWAPVLPGLQKHFTVTVFDRRGRGASGDGDRYALDREVEDVVAIVGTLRPPVLLFGHSYGGICSLEAASRTTVAGLLLYEPPVVFGERQIYTREQLHQLEALLAADDREQVIATFMKEIVHLTPEAINAARSSPAWAARVASAHTLPRELRAQAEYRFCATRFNGLKSPSFLLLGNDSPAFFASAAESLANGLPRSRLLRMAGQQHIAMDTAPDIVVRAILDFQHVISAA